METFSQRSWQCRLNVGDAILARCTAPEEDSKLPEVLVTQVGEVLAGGFRSRGNEHESECEGDDPGMHMPRWLQEYVKPTEEEELQAAAIEASLRDLAASLTTYRREAAAAALAAEATATATKEALPSSACASNAPVATIAPQSSCPGSKKRRLLGWQIN